MSACRSCGSPLFAEPLLRYQGMPKAAQFLPGRAELAAERGVDLDVRQCSGCGLVQLSNEPVHYYREVVRAAAFSEEMGAYRQKQFAAFAARFALRGKKLLEVGCGRGEYLSLLAGSGVDAHGLEGSEESVRACVAMGLKAAPGFLSSDTVLDGAPFDAFCLLQYLEHLPDPGSVLRGISRNLAESGVGLVEVPNFDMILRKDLFSEFIPDHLFYFTRETLTTTLRLHGFETLEVAETWHDYILTAVARKRAPLDLGRFHLQEARLKEQLGAFIASYGEREVAAWGAGHQALAVIALAGLARKLRYVVDSAPFKQGKFTPATHVPIVPPEALDSDPVKALIIMAGSYSEEVARIVRRRAGGALRLAILRESGLEIEAA